jgi:hypothetical protein
MIQHCVRMRKQGVVDYFKELSQHSRRDPGNVPVMIAGDLVDFTTSCLPNISWKRYE